MNPLKTPRLLLRPFTPSDLAAIAPLFADPEVMRFGDGTHDEDWTRRWLRGCAEDYSRHGFGLLAVEKEAAVLGFCGITRFPKIDGRQEDEVGYRLLKAHWGHGYATEAATAVRDHAFGPLALRRLISIIDPLNTASIRVAEKLGMKHEKTCDAFKSGQPLRIYALSAR